MTALRTRLRRLRAVGRLAEARIVQAQIAAMYAAEFAAVAS